MDFVPQAAKLSDKTISIKHPRGARNLCVIGNRQQSFLIKLDFILSKKVLLVIISLLDLNMCSVIQDLLVSSSTETRITSIVVVLRGIGLRL